MIGLQPPIEIDTLASSLTKYWDWGERAEALIGAWFEYGVRPIRLLKPRPI
jgi:hypothetical protein